MGEHQYLILDKIAAGGMAEVFRAKSLGVKGFEKIVAIKRILPALNEDAEFVQMFVEEAKIAGRLRHANIARILELGKIEGHHFIAMEYVFGKDLVQIKARLQEEGRHAPPKMAAWVLSNVLAGLDYAHRQRGADGKPLGLIHRDVSPPNILVSHDGQVKLIDFGIAKAASRATQTVAGVLKGKLGYMSPEQVTGLPIDHRSDIFAVSTCLHELLTGQRLFTKKSDIETIDAVKTAVIEPPSSVNPNVPAELDAVVMKGLARDPNNRWSTAGEMHEELMMFALTKKPAFGAAQLREWMAETFATEKVSQSAHLERLAEVSEPGVEVSKARVEPPAALGLWDDEETTTVNLSPEISGDYVELSSLVVIDNVVDRFSSPGSAPPGPAPLIRQIGRPDPTTPFNKTTPDNNARDNSTRDAAAVQAASVEIVSIEVPSVVVASVEVPSVVVASVEVETGAVETASLQARAMPDEAETADLPVEAPIKAIKQPRVSAVRTVKLAAVHSQDTPARRDGVPTPRPTPAPIPEVGGGVRWGALIAVALIAAVVGVGAVIGWLYLSGRGLPFSF